MTTSADKFAPDSPPKIPIHQWARDNGEVLILRCIGKDGKSYGGFQNPLEVGALLTAPEKWDESWGPEPSNWIGGWRPNQTCGGGIHGWPWGIGLGDGKEPNWSGLWQVYGAKPVDVIGDVEGPKCKFREGALRYSGDWHGAAMFILSGQMAWAFDTSEGAASNSGDRGAALSTGPYSSVESLPVGTAAMESIRQMRRSELCQAQIVSQLQSLS